MRNTPGEKIKSFIPFQFPEQPSPREYPVALRSGRRNAEGLGGFLDGHADEIAQLHHLGLARFDLGETIIATPSISHGGLYFRSDGHLWKITKS